MSDSMNPNRGPQAERLARFTPDASALDRDALMFAAGRASVRTGRFWPCLAGLLAAAQAVTLTLLLTERTTPPSPAASQPVAVVPVEPERAEAESPDPSPLERDSLISQRHLLRDDLETGYRPISNAIPMTDPKVIFTAHSKLNWE
jgi:hypothetical protein